MDSHQFNPLRAELFIGTGWETKICWYSPELGSLLYIAYPKFHSPRPVFHSPSQISTHIGEQPSASFPACRKL